MSLTERRKLATFPKVSTQTILQGTFATQFEEYATDQFPLRDSFRTIKALSNYYLFQQKDNNGIYIRNGYASKLLYPYNVQSVQNACNKMQAIYDMYCKDTSGKKYATVVPDKGFFLAESGGYLSLDYEKLFADFKQGLPFAQYIDIADTLQLTDYYKTDTHWRQEYLVDTAKKIAEAMGISDEISWNFTKVVTDQPFYGVYYGQSALPLKSETISYLTNPVIEGTKVYHPDTDKWTPVYDMDKLSSRDPYEMFLSGAVPILVMENDSVANDKELIVFRDSFGSSLVPLLTEAYSKITLVDTRYISSNLIGEYVDFKDADVLFMYSSLVLNDSFTLK